MVRIAFAAAFAAATIAGPALAGSITLYDEAGFRGASVTVRHDVENFAKHAPWNDRARSLVVNSGTWEICKHKNFKDCTVLRRGSQVADLGQIGYFRQISSVRELDTYADRGRDRDWDDRRRRDDWDRDPWDRDPWDRDGRRDDRRDRDDRWGRDDDWGRNDDWDRGSRWDPPRRPRDTVMWNDTRRGNLSSCQRRVFEGFVQRFGYEAPASFSGAPDEGAINWNGQYWQFRCTASEINIWQ
ncbi:MAG TPA: beta/gamma crystallin-related protein [Azospirillaceae bacterium]|nr:beta/gamma crystallin-related protein [Azospirillaceae bacterium]